MGHSSRRGVSLALILGLNAAWLYAVMCASLCAAGVCPNETPPAMSEHCQNKQASGLNHSCPCHQPNCLWHGRPARVFLLPASIQAPPNLQRLAGRAVPSASMIPAANAPVAALDTASHSPPGGGTGRTICQKQSLLRI